MKQPQQYTKRTLFAVIGMTPQIITETLYALAVKQQPAFVPTDIKIVTTQRGAEQVKLNLLSDDVGWFKRFCQDYGFSDIQFSENDIQVLTDTGGHFLEDIREPAENELMADAITETIRELTRDEDRAVHVSIAGGRKTMGFYAGYALSLFGREQDRLSHVLVEKDFESLKDFYYPTPYNKTIQQGTMPFNSAKAKVSLAEIPFVSLREGLPNRLLEGTATFGETVQLAKKILKPAKVILHKKTNSVECADEMIQLSPRNFAFYLWLANRKINNLPAVRWTDSSIAKEYIEVYEQIVGAASGHLDKVKATLRTEGQHKNLPEDQIEYSFQQDYFEQRKAAVKKALVQGLGESCYASYFFNNLGKPPEMRIELAVKKENIAIK